MRALHSRTAKPLNMRQRLVVDHWKCPSTNQNQIQHETIRITVIQRLEQLLQISNRDHRIEEEPTTKRGSDKFHIYGLEMGEKWDPSLEDDAEDSQFDPFGDLYKQRFLWYYDIYLSTMEKSREDIKDGKAFPTTDFEYGSNNMTGKYACKSLIRRLKHIRKVLDDEVEAWIETGLDAESDSRGIAFNLRHQFEQHSHHYQKSPIPVEISLVKDNPFVWNLTFFGKAETDLYGATINVRIVFSINFPQQQPRVTVLTPLFHHRISKTGNILCYFNTKPESIRDHIECIMASIEEEHPAYDPRTLVNPEAAALLWGKDDERKMYRRKLRRSVQDSMESMDEF